MAVFFSIETDAFQDTFARKSSSTQSARRAGAARVRRPLRGLEIKDDTYAIIKVIQADGTELPLIDSGSQYGYNTQYANFILQSVQEARMEKHQIVETFGESYIFFFGEAPRFIDVNVLLINSNDFNWEAEWWGNYNAYLRGTKTVELGARTYLFYDDNIVEGYMLNAQAVKQADLPLSVQLTFRMFITNYQNISFVTSPAFPIRASVSIPAAGSAPGGLASSLGSTASLTQQMSPEQLNQFVAQVTGTDSNGLASGGFDLIRNAPLRGNIIDNVDEWTGPPPEGGPNPFDALQQQVIHDLQEAQDALQTLISTVGGFGVDVNNPAFMLAMGLGPNFTQFNGFGATADATFGATVGIDLSISASLSFGSQSADTQNQTLEQQELQQVIQQQLKEAQAQQALDANGGPIIFQGQSPPTFGVSFTAAASVSLSASASFGTTNNGNVNSNSNQFVLAAGASFSAGSNAGASSNVGGNPSAFAMASFSGSLTV